MSGRQERVDRINQHLLETMEGYPPILGEYYYNFVKKTARTKNMYISRVMNFMDYLKTELNKDIYDIDTYDQLKKSDINKYMNRMEYYTRNGEEYKRGESAKMNILSALCDFFDFLVDEEYIRRNPCSRIEKPSVNKEKEVVDMTESEVEELRDRIRMDPENEERIDYHRQWKNRDLAIVTIGCRTGLRLSAICDIDIQDLDFDRNCIHVIEKGNKDKEVMFGDDTAAVIKSWMIDRKKLLIGHQDCEALFISNRRTRISCRAVQDMVSKYTAGMDKHITPHKMRSTFGTNLYAKTGDIYLVQKALGHQNINNTKRYTRVAEDRMRKAAEIMDKI